MGELGDNGGGLSDPLLRLELMISAAESDDEKARLAMQNKFFRALEYIVS